MNVFRRRCQSVARVFVATATLLAMQPRTSKALALLGGVATLALGSMFMLRRSPPKARPLQAPCAPRLMEQERAVCQPLTATAPVEVARFSVN